MYLITASYARSKREWLEVDLASKKMSEVLTGFEEVHITLDNDGSLVNWRPMTSEFYADMYSTSYTLLEWISHCNDNDIRLDVTSTPFTFTGLKRIDSYSAFDVGFNVERSNAYINPASDANSLGKDLRLSRDNTDYSLLVGKVLVSINGVVHPLILNDFGMYAKGGYDALHGSTIRDINLINFENIGGYVVERLPRSKMYKMDKGSVKWYDNCCFDLGYDVTNKVFGVVLDGYLHLLDGVIEIVGKTQIKVDWRKVPLLDRAIKIKGKTPWLTTVRNKELVSESDVTSNEWIEDIVSSMFTFLMVFNRPDITKSITPLISKGLPGVYEYPHDLTGVAFTGDGETFSYKKSRDRCSYDIAREEYTMFNLPLMGHYPDSFDTRLGGKTQYGTQGSYVGGKGFIMDKVKMVQYHVLPENF